MAVTSTRETYDPGLAGVASLLPHVSRTFALTIPLLNEPVRSRVALSYLLCRVADTIEDRDDVNAEKRFELFRLFLDRVADPSDEDAGRRFDERWPPYPEPHHDRLVRHTEDLLRAMMEWPPPVQRDLQACLDEMVAGMSTHPMSGEPRRPVEACADLKDLETYCHFVAGTVGHLLTRLFARELPPDWMDAERLEAGRRFGLGLQLTNVLKDHAADRRRGITYIPRRWLLPGTRHPSPEGIQSLVRRALEHLDIANSYVLSIPPARADLRRFCLGASHLALATLAHLARPAGPGKVTRAEVAAILEWLPAGAPDDGAVGAAHAGHVARVREALDALAGASG